MIPGGETISSLEMSSLEAESYLWRCTGPISPPPPKKKIPVTMSTLQLFWAHNYLPYSKHTRNILDKKAWLRTIVDDWSFGLLQGSPAPFLEFYPPAGSVQPQF